MKTLLSLIAVVAGLTACGGPSAQPSHAGAPVAPTAAPSAAPPPTGPLFAVLESSAPEGTPADTVAIVGLDGYARAKVAFQPRRGPYMPMQAMMVQSEAQVGAAGVYYADGNGVVRLLRPTGESNVVATFSMAPAQHDLWYAVSPDGTRLLAGILNMPAVIPPPPGQDVPPTMMGAWSFDLESASAGGPTHTLRHFESPEGTESLWKPIFPVGWTTGGPVAMVGGPISTQNVWYGGPIFSVDAAGQTTTRVGGGDCTSAQVLPSGTMACVLNGFDVSVAVRNASGRAAWKPQVDGYNALALKLSPDGDAITDGRHAAAAAGTVTLPDGFIGQGWLDSRTLVGRRADGELAYVNLDSPQTLHDLGFKGSFVGLVPSR